MHWHHSATLTLSSLLKAAVDVTAAERAVLCLLEGETASGWRLYPIASVANGSEVTIDGGGPMTNKVPLNNFATLLGACARTCNIINVRDATSNAAFGTGSMWPFEDAVKSVTRSAMCVPLAGGNGATKVIVLLASAQKCFFTRAHEMCLRALVTVGASSAEDIAHLYVLRECGAESWYSCWSVCSHKHFGRHLLFSWQGFFSQCDESG